MKIETPEYYKSYSMVRLGNYRSTGGPMETKLDELRKVVHPCL